MTVSLYTFLAIDGTTVEINADRIDKMVPYSYPIPQGVAQGTLITVDQIDVAVQNSLQVINSVTGLGSIAIPLSQPSGAPFNFPAVLGSSQNDPFRFIDPRYFQLWTNQNTPDGMANTFFLSKVTKYPPWLDTSSKGQQGFVHTFMDLTIPAAPPIDQTWIQTFTALQLSEGLDKLLPQRNYYDTGLPPAYGDINGPNYNYADTNFYQPPPKTNFPSWG